MLFTENAANSSLSSRTDRLIRRQSQLPLPVPGVAVQSQSLRSQTEIAA
jgi:hypothetical protein